MDKCPGHRINTEVLKSLPNNAAVDCVYFLLNHFYYVENGFVFFSIVITGFAFLNTY